MTWPHGYELALHDELDSTNLEALRLSQQGQAGPLWITAARQTSGRGRRGRVWQSPPGNLAATLLIQPARGKSEWPQLSFVAALAVADMVAHFAPNSVIAVKWPNDVLAEQKKLAGILLESAGSHFAIGIGVNLAAHPENTEYPATSLAALGVTAPSPSDALAQLAQSFARWYEQWRGAGFAPIRDAWLARAAGLGCSVTARLPTCDYSGVFEGIDASGALLLKETNTVRTITAGEVFWA